jgi:hypothetical protein
VTEGRFIYLVNIEIWISLKLLRPQTAVITLYWCTTIFIFLMTAVFTLIDSAIKRFISPSTLNSHLICLVSIIFIQISFPLLTVFPLPLIIILIFYVFTLNRLIYLYLLFSTLLLLLLLVVVFVLFWITLWSINISMLIDWSFRWRAIPVS